jgi:hypothetical protein
MIAGSVEANPWLYFPEAEAGDRQNRVDTGNCPASGNCRPQPVTRKAEMAASKRPLAGWDKLRLNSHAPQIGGSTFRGANRYVIRRLDGKFGPMNSVKSDSSIS